MAFKPGQSGNPFGRPRRVDPRSQEVQEFCKEHREDIKKVGEVALKHAVLNDEPWAVKLCLEYFYPKPGTFVAISKEESKEVNLNFINALPYEEQQTFLRIWMKCKKVIGAFPEMNNPNETSVDGAYTINNAKEAEFIDENTEERKPE